MAAPPRIAATKAQVQGIFNERYLNRVIGGQLRTVVRHRGPATAASNQPAGTESIVEEYWDDTLGIQVALAHYYWLPDSAGLLWRIGGSGVPDGKMVYADGVVLYIQE
jgi:hypothetical protein